MDTRTTDTQPSSGTRLGRLAGVLLAAAAGWVAGFYAAIFLILSLIGLDDFEGWQFELGTALLGTLGAALAAHLASRSRRSERRPFGRVAGVLAVTLALGAFLLDPDFAAAILGGGAVAVIVLTAAAGT
jgi:hypothetical protein